MIEVSEVAVERANAWGLRLFAGALVAAHAFLVCETVQTACPPVPTANHRRLDEKPVPLPGRSQGAGHNRLILTVSRLCRLGSRAIEQGQLCRHRGTGKLGRGVVWRHPRRAGARWRPFSGEERNLSE